MANFPVHGSCLRFYFKSCVNLYYSMVGQLVVMMSVVTVGYSMFVVPLRIVTCVGLVNKFMQNILGYPDSSGKDQMA